MPIKYSKPSSNPTFIKHPPEEKLNLAAIPPQIATSGTEAIEGITVTESVGKLFEQFFLELGNPAAFRGKGIREEWLKPLAALCQDYSQEDVQEAIHYALCENDYWQRLIKIYYSSRGAANPMDCFYRSFDKIYTQVQANRVTANIQQREVEKKLIQDKIRSSGGGLDVAAKVYQTCSYDMKKERARLDKIEKGEPVDDN